MNHSSKIISTLVLMLLASVPLWSVPLHNYPLRLTQPDGVVLECYANGDEFYNWLHDENGYTIQQNDQGWYVYVRRAGSELVFTDLIVGRDMPDKSVSPGEQLPESEIRRITDKERARLASRCSNYAPTRSLLNNLVIFVRFDDQPEFGQTIDTYSTMCNGLNANTMQAYFKEVSYDALNVVSSFYPLSENNMIVSWPDSHTRNYYLPFHLILNPIGYHGDNQRFEREFGLLERAIIGVRDAIPSSLVIDRDGNGFVDNVCFIIQGDLESGQNQILNPHRGHFGDRDVRINGIRVGMYNILLSEHLLLTGTGTLCHEMFHSLGAPDLYRYNQEIGDRFGPMGKWDLMSYPTNPPQHMCAYMKSKYGNWIAPPDTISVHKHYMLNPLTSPTGNAYAIKSPNSETEYFVVEYRNRSGLFESSLPNSGMLIYRINSQVTGNEEGSVYEIYVYRPEGTLNNIGQFDEANYSYDVGRTAIGENTIPSPFLSDGSPGGLEINNIGMAGSFTSFYLGPVSTPETLIAGEYFIDIDPGPGNGIPLTGPFTTNNVTATAAINTSSLSPGCHTLYTRFQDNNNLWGQTQATLLRIGKPEDLTLADGEYFIDSDPGSGNGTPLIGQFTNDNVTATAGINTSDLLPGCHMLYSRFKDNYNRWGETQATLLRIGKAEDQTLAAACYELVTPAGTISGSLDGTFGSSQCAASALEVETTDLSFGSYPLQIRYQDSEGQWGDPQAVLLSIGNPNHGHIALGEYCIDDGEFMPLSGSFGGSMVNGFAYNLPTNGLNLGYHRVYARFKDSEDNWSPTECEVVTVLYDPPELIRNWSCEEALINSNIPAWDEVVGTVWTRRNTTPPGPVEGSYYFFAGKVANAELKQDVDVSPYRYNIDRGRQYFDFSGYVRSYDQTPTDNSRIVVEYLNGEKMLISTGFDTGNCNNTAQWDRKSHTGLAPVGTRYVRIRLISTRQSSSGNNDGYYDCLSLKPILYTTIATPLPPSQVSSVHDGGTILITWDPVTEDINGHPISISLYSIEASDNPYTGFTVVGTTPQTYFEDIVDTHQKRFYRIRALAGSRPEVIDQKKSSFTNIKME